MCKPKIYVTQPVLPDLEEYKTVLAGVWQSKLLTNNGPLVQKFEKEVERQLEIDNYIAVVSGTLALQISTRLLSLKGNIIVPAFSWIASASSVMWEGLEIKYCDINPETFNICTNSLRETIDENTVAIMPVHVFGNPADISTIQAIACDFNLKVIYDAAHAFGAKYESQSVLQYGDVSCTSTHATKVINTGEGGGIVISNNIKLSERAKRLRYFGHDNNNNIVDIGTNGKMYEIHAALGLLTLKELNNVLLSRQEINDLYRIYLADNEIISFQRLMPGANHAYFPILIKDKVKLLRVLDDLRDQGIYARRYFYPSLSDIKLFDSKKCPNSSLVIQSNYMLAILLWINERDN